MDFSLSEDQMQIQKQARRFAEEHIRPVAAHYDQTESFPWEALKKAAEGGLYGLDFFERQRQDASGMTAPIVSEEFAWGCGGIALAILSTRLPYYALASYGTREQMAEWAPVMFGTALDPKVAAFALTEPQAGSDVSAIRTSAQRDGEHWVLNGRKAFVTNGGIADVHIVVATVEPSLGARGHALFVVRRQDEGFHQGQKDKKHGVRASHTCELFLRDVHIPLDRVLGGVDALDRRLELARAKDAAPGRSVALRPVEMTRPLVAAQAVGVARAALEYATEYAGKRVQFGRPIFEQGSIAESLAEMSVEVDAARLLVRRAAWAAATGAPTERAAGSAAKLKAARVAAEVTDRALRILGGHGYMRKTPVEKWCRDAHVYGLLEGTSEIQLKIIAKTLGQVRRQGEEGKIFFEG